MFSASANFAFIPYYPFWSLLIITLDILVIWAIAAHGSARMRARGAQRCFDRPRAGPRIARQAARSTTAPRIEPMMPLAAAPARPR